MTLGLGVEGEAAIARAGLALGARERVLLVRVRMQEHREVAADGDVAVVEHVLDVGADDDPVAIDDRMAEQRIAHRAADEVAFHRGKSRSAHRALRTRDEPSSIPHGRGMVDAGANRYIADVCGVA